MNKQNDNEEDILKSYENNEWKSAADFKKLKEEFESYALHTFRKAQFLIDDRKIYCHATLRYSQQ
jgi:hypothetical protein